MEVNHPASGSALNIYVGPDTLIAPLHTPGGADNTAGGEVDCDGDNDEGDESDDEDVSGPSVHIVKGVNDALEEIEEELGVTEGLLRDNIDGFLCREGENKSFGKARTMELLSRISSPINNKYIDVHFSHHFRSRVEYCQLLEWFYTIGFKISSHATPRAQTPPLQTATLEMLRDHPITHRYGTQGWRSIAYAFLDDKVNVERMGGSNARFSFDMDMDDFVDVHDALWGPLDPLEELPPDASEEDEIEHRETLIRALRVLLAAIGIDYYIACSDDDDDLAPDQDDNDGGQLGWVLEGADERWIAKGARQACGFELERDYDCGF